MQMKHTCGSCYSSPSTCGSSLFNSLKHTTVVPDSSADNPLKERFNNQVGLIIYMLRSECILTDDVFVNREALILDSHLSVHLMSLLIIYFPKHHYKQP